VDGDDGIAMVVGAGEKDFGFEFFGVGSEPRELGLEFLFYRLPFVSQFEQSGEVGEVALEFGVGLKLALDALAPLE